LHVRWAKAQGTAKATIVAAITLVIFDLQPMLVFLTVLLKMHL
jgi:hypothetical protein